MHSDASELGLITIRKSIIYYPHFTHGKTEVWSANSKCLFQCCGQEQSPDFLSHICAFTWTELWECQVLVTDLSNNMFLNICHRGYVSLYWLNRFFFEISSRDIEGVCSCCWETEQKTQIYSFLWECLQLSKLFGLFGKHLNYVCFWVLGIMIIKQFGI